MHQLMDPVDPVADQPFSADELSAVDRIVEQYRNRPGALIPVLEEVQEILGYLPKSIQKRISKSMRIPLRRSMGWCRFTLSLPWCPAGATPPAAAWERPVMCAGVKTTWRN
jgi:NADH:ubiquinone oxidoreductase subunit E